MLCYCFGQSSSQLGVLINIFLLHWEIGGDYITVLDVINRKLWPEYFYSSCVADVVYCLLL